MQLDGTFLLTQILVRSRPNKGQLRNTAGKSVIVDSSWLTRRWDSVAWFPLGNWLGFRWLAGRWDSVIGFPLVSWALGQSDWVPAS